MHQYYYFCGIYLPKINHHITSLQHTHLLLRCVMCNHTLTEQIRSGTVSLDTILYMIMNI